MTCRFEKFDKGPIKETNVYAKRHVKEMLIYEERPVIETYTNEKREKQT